MAQLGMPLNGVAYDAAKAGRWLYGRTNGVFSGDSELRVTAAGGLTISVSPGAAFMTPSRFRGIVYTNDSPVTLACAMAHSSLNRIDRVVVRWNVTQFGEHPQLAIKQGDYAATPVAPTITRNSNTWELGIADVTINAGTITLSQAMITDQRLNESVCGVVRDGVEHIPTEGLNVQFQNWFADTKKQLSGDPLVGHIPAAIASPEGVHGFRYHDAQLSYLQDGIWRDAVPDFSGRLYILRILFDVGMVGSAFTVAGGGFSYSGTVPSDLTAVVPVEGNTTYTVTCGSRSETVEVGRYFGIYQVAFAGHNLDAMSWTQIADIAGRGNPSEMATYFAVGDEKTITLTTGEQLTLQIYDLFHDNLEGGGKASITFGLKNLMAEPRQMNSEEKNDWGFGGSEMAYYLGQEVFPTLPADLQGVIKIVKRPTTIGNGNHMLTDPSLKMFLFAEVECFGTQPASAGLEGELYPIFTDNTSRIKQMANGLGAPAWWWLASPSVKTPFTGFCQITSEGISPVNVLEWTGNPTIAAGVCFGFCV